MTARLDPFSQLLVHSERASQPMHAGSIELLEPPASAPEDFVTDLVERLRAIPARAPFNQALTGTLRHAWKNVAVDMHYHVRHIRLPAPGSLDQLMAWSEGFYGAPLNRSLPLWELWVVEGIEGGRFAIAMKAHHALGDGQGGMRMFFDAFALSADDTVIRAPWGDNADSQVHGRPVEGKGARVSGNTRPVASPAGRGRLGPMARNAGALWPLRGKPNRLNGAPLTAARRFGFCDLSLLRLKAAGREHDATINDLLVTLVDHATHRYLAEHGDAQQGPLTLLMPMSMRKEGASTGGNQVTGVTASLGAPTSALLERLASVRKSLSRGKSAVSQLPRAAQIAYSALLVAVAPPLARAVGALGLSVSPFNLVVSNISPPRSAWYVDRPVFLGGARLVGFYVQPILMGSTLLNVTVVGYDSTLNVGIGSVPGAIDSPMTLGAYMVEALENL